MPARAELIPNRSFRSHGAPLTVECVLALLPSGRVVLAAADGSGPPAGARVVPDAFTPEQAAALPLAGLTALRLLRPARLDCFAHFGQAGAAIRHFHYETALAALRDRRIRGNAVLTIEETLT